jgi:hypothetical protein
LFVSRSLDDPIEACQLVDALACGQHDRICWWSSIMG